MQINISKKNYRKSMQTDKKNKNKEFVVGQEYDMLYYKSIPTKRFRGSSTPSQWVTERVMGTYEYISQRGSKMHFYDNERGIDILITKTEARKYTKNYEQISE